MVLRQHRCGCRYPFPSLILVALVLLGLGGGVQAQKYQTRFQRDIVVGSGLHYQSWSQKGESGISEFSVPLVFVLPVSKRLSVDLVAGSGSASLDAGGSLSGLADTKVRASYILGDELALLTAGVSAPTGKTELTKEEQGVSNSLAQGALNFRTPNFGQGLDINAGIATAFKLGESVLGLGAGYLLKGEFMPKTDGHKYKPGSELSLTAGVDRKLGEGAGKVTVDAIYTLYGDDAQDGERVFRPGAKLLVQGLLALKAAGLDWHLYGVERLRAKSERFRGGLTSQVSNGNQLEAGISVLKELSPSLAVRGLADLKTYADNASDFGAIRVEQGEASIFSIGPGVRYQLGPGRFIDLNLKYGSGKIDTDSVSGLELSGGIWFRI